MSCPLSPCPARCLPTAVTPLHIPCQVPPLVQCQGWPLAPCHPSWLAPAHKCHCPAAGRPLAQLRAAQGVTPFLPAGRVPALPPLRDPQGPAGRVALPQCCQRNQGVQVHLPQQRGDHPSLSLRGPVTAVSRAHTQVCAGLGLGSSPVPTLVLPRPPQPCLHALGRAESMSCASGTQIPPAGTPAEMLAAICTALSPQMHPHLLCHPPCPARSLSTCPVVPQESGWVQGCQSHGHCWYQSWATLRGRQEPGGKAATAEAAGTAGSTRQGHPQPPAGTPRHPAAEGPGQGCARAGWPLTPERGTGTARQSPGNGAGGWTQLGPHRPG